MIKIVIEDDQGKREEKSLSAADIIIGRDSYCQVRLNDRNVSRQHAHLFQKGDAVFLEDLNSYNGLYINGDRVIGCKKLNGRDIVTIGDYQLEISGGGIIAPREESTLRYDGSVDDSEAATLPGVYPCEDTDTDQTIPDGEVSDYSRDESSLPRVPGGSIRSSKPAPAPAAAPAASKAAQQQRDLVAALRSVKDDDPVEDGPRHEPTALIRLDQIDLSAFENKSGHIQSDQQPKLLCVSTDLAGKEFVLTKNENIIGRIGEGNDIQIDHRSISKHHAKIIINNGSYRIMDLKSANGTLVNGEEYAQTTLRQGDMIELGHVRLRFITPGKSYQPNQEEAEAIAMAQNPGMAKSQQANKPAYSEPADFSRHEKPDNPNKGLTFMIGTMIVLMLLALVAVGAIFLFFVKDGNRGGMVAQDKPAPVTAPAPAAAPGTPTPEAQNLYQKALAAYNGKRFEEAKTLIDATLTISPAYVDALTLKSKMSVDGKSDELITEATKAMNAKRFEEANRLLSEVSSESSRFEEVKQLKARVQSGLIDELYERGIRALENNELGRAKDTANKIGVIDPNAPQLGELRDQIALVVERNDEQRRQAAAASKESNTSARNEVASKPKTPAAKDPAPVAKAEPKPAKPAPAKEAAPAPAPAPAASGNTPRELYAAASKQVMANDFGSAIKTFNTCIQVDSKFCQCYRGLGIAYAKYRQSANAVKYYKRYLACDPNAKDFAAVTKIIQQYESN